MEDSAEEWTSRIDLNFRVREDMGEALREAIATEYKSFRLEIIICTKVLAR